jgi:hypothetical protein
MNSTIDKNRSFAPKIRMEGVHGMSEPYDITPRGWQWVLGFALAGCQWAIDKASTEEFRMIIHQDLAKTNKHNLEASIKVAEEKLAELKGRYNREG